VFMGRVARVGNGLCDHAVSAMTSVANFGKTNKQQQLQKQA